MAAPSSTPSRPPGMPVTDKGGTLPHSGQAAYGVINGNSKRTHTVPKYPQRAYNLTVETLNPPCLSDVRARRGGPVASA